MSEQDIKVLNSVTKTLIDSCDGYKTCRDLADDNSVLRAEFSRRYAARQELVAEFQAAVRALGGTPEKEGSLSGAVHRGFARFTAMFQDDKKAAISALDDGEEFLAEKIDDRLEDSVLKRDTLDLLRKARSSAQSGEALADSLED